MRTRVQNIRRSIRRGHPIAGAFLLAALLAGCETARDPQLLDNPNYLSGYGDGCQSSHTRVIGFDDSVTRNQALVGSEPAYEIGWRDGYHACGGAEFDPDAASDREIFQRGSDNYTSVPR